MSNLLGVEAFRAELARVDDQCGGGDVIDVAVEHYVAALVRCAALQARMWALEAALTRYGWHEGFCDRYRIFGEPSMDEPCSCGYDAVLTPNPGQ
jgi:hypothetical protein